MDSLTTRYRPQIWANIVGQDHIVDSLVKSVKSKNLASAYLFVGLMGTGKTTTARVLAKALNCESPLENGDPCDECHSCKAILAGNSMDVKELDMATNRGIDDVRAIKEFAAYSSVGGKYRIFICDEAHQLTSQASSALLKILEEPPQNVIFILCTTELQKILGTIRSRCQVYSFKRIAEDVIVNRLTGICMAEDIIPEQGVLLEIAKNCDGSMRNAESKLSNLISLGEVTFTAYKQQFGAGSEPLLEEILNLCLRKDKIAIVKRFKEISEDIVDGGKWAGTFAEYIFNRILKDEKNAKSYLAILDVVEGYLFQLYQNQPIVFLEAMLIKIASLDIKVDGINTELQQYSAKKVYDVWDLARHLMPYEIILVAGSEVNPLLFDFKIAGATLQVWTEIQEKVNNVDALKRNLKLPATYIDKFEKILALPKETEPQILVDLGLIDV
jgi:DNA polymerase-3 subunit gamma/tau